MTKHTDHTGRRVGQVEFLRPTGTTAKDNRAALWFVRCHECQRDRVMRYQPNLRSCGCTNPAHHNYMHVRPGSQENKR